MKYLGIFLFAIVSTTLIYNCSVPRNTNEIIVYEDNLSTTTGEKLNFVFKNGKEFNHPTYVIWMEDLYGNYIKTLFVTKSYSSGIFGHQMVGDTVWLKTKGESHQPAALPYWTNKKGLINDSKLIPTPEDPFVDAYSGATPLHDFNFKTTVSENRPYRIFIEINQTWDWNEYWTNNKYPDNHAYKHSAQPSIIYAVTVNKDQDSFYMNPIGHGDPKGETGRLFTQLNTLTTAQNIFESIEIVISN